MDTHAASAVSAFLGEWVDCGIILFVVILNAVLGSVQKAGRRPRSRRLRI
jgi:magnesium-transporting ATPase (P-type)